MKEIIKEYRLIFIPELLQDALQEVPRNDAKVSYLRKCVHQLKKQYGK